MRGHPGELIEAIELNGRVYQIRRGTEPGAPHRTEVWWRIGHRVNGSMQWDLDIYFAERARVAMDTQELRVHLAEIHAADVEAAKLGVDEQGRP